MSQSQIQDIPQLYYDTWGSFGQNQLVFLILPNNEKIDPRRIVDSLRLWKGEKTETTLKIGEYEVILEAINDSSNKNAHYKINILAIKPKPEYIILVEERRSSRNFRRKISVIDEQGEREIEPKISLRVEEKQNGRYIYKYNIREIYVEVNGRKHVIRKEKEYIGKELIGKPQVKIVKREGKIYVYGDTYPIKEELKRLGLRWNPLERAWYGVIEKEELVQALEDIAEVMG